MAGRGRPKGGVAKTSPLKSKKAKTAKASPKKKATKASPVKKRKQKKEKDPNAPKRAMTAFFCFSNEVRQKTRDAHPEKKMTEIAQLIGEMWKKLSPADLAKYTKMAEQDKVRYEKAMAAYKKKQ
eukprot:Nk52_evm1s2343 gene=Nk52_evmTU1s2343